MGLSKNESAVAGWHLVEDLAEAALVDTVYGDLYLQRARQLLESALSKDEFAALQLMETEAVNLPNRIFVAMKQGKWTEVKELTSRLSSVKRILADKESLRQLGEKIYDRSEPSLDPFSPGLQVLAKSGELQALMQKLSAQLERLQAADLDWRDFYAVRKVAMTTIKIDSPQAPEEGNLTGSRLEQKAFEALNRGDFANLEEMADRMAKENPGGTEGVSRPAFDSTVQSHNLTYQFPQVVLDRARDLGLAPFRMEAGSRFLNLSPQELAPLYRHLWHPTFTEEISREGTGWVQKELPLPADAPAALKDLIELFTLHPFVNSGGARYVPVLAEEDVLVEDFDEPNPGMQSAASELLSVLGIHDRRGLTRVQLEKALIDHGNQIVCNLQLDPRIFRLVCIPPDVYGRIGPQMGWGRKELWTHFDGYMVMKNGKLVALAGGDVRFGGLYDQVGISREYCSDRIIARLAVVQRRRMEAAG